MSKLKSVGETDGGSRSETEIVQNRTIAQLLTSVDREANVSQRRLASELGIALGLVNTYIKRCVRKGLIKIQQVPSRRYAYYLTPHGFAEKSRLTAEYLAWSMTFFRRARGECAELMLVAKDRGWRSIGMAGGGDLAEIAIMSAAEHGLVVLALLDAEMNRTSLLGIAVFRTLEGLFPEPDGWIVTDVENAQSTYETLVMFAGLGEGADA